MSDDKIITGFFLAPTPNHMSDERIAKLFDDDFKVAEATAAMLDRVQAKAIPCNLPELFFHSPQRRKMVFDHVPVGHSIGYRCYDGDKHDAESAFESSEFGDGMSEDEAYVDWLRNVDEPKPKAGRVIHSSPFEPETLISDRPEWRDED